MNIRFYLLFVFISPQVLFAQDKLTTTNNQSFESWNALQIQYALTEKLSLDLETQLRLKSFGDTYNMSFFEVQAQYELQPFLELGAGYRNSDRLYDVGKIQGHEKYNRFFGFANVKTTFNRFDFRFRIQHQVKTQRNVSIDPKDNSRWRYKLASRYNFPNWSFDPRFSVEFFIKNAFLTNEAFDKIRFSIGSKWDISKQRSLEFRYLLESEVNTLSPMRYHILSLKYVFEIVSQKKD